MGRPTIVVFLAFALATPAAAAPPLVADLSNSEIAITTGFSGTDILLFGATEGAGGDVAVVVRGPTRRQVVHRREQVAGVWVNGAAVAFEDVPGFYFVAATRPLAEIAPDETLRRLQLGVSRLRLVTREDLPPAAVAQFRSGLLQVMRARDLYSERTGTVALIQDRLFRARVYFPANVPTGVYVAEAYLFRDGREIAVQRTPVIVRKAGIEARVYDFAQEDSAIYGLIAIALALMAGWLAGLVFRKS